MQKEKIKISIVSSLDGLSLAKSLQESLTTEVSEAHIWNGASDRGVSQTIIEMLHEAAKAHDFAVIILTRGDVVGSGDKERRPARDTGFAAAGLFMGALGRDRCFLVSSARKSELPADLHAMNFLYFSGLEDLASSEQGKQTPFEEINRLIKERGRVIRQESPPVLSFEEILEKERIEKGDIIRPDREKHESSVVVACDILPIEGFAWAVQIKENLDNGAHYYYFFHAEAEGARRICRLLQMILLADVFKDNVSKGESFQDCYEKIKECKDSVIINLQKIIVQDTLDIYFTPFESGFNFRIHNAENSRFAKSYLRYGQKYVDWTGSGNVTSVYEWLRRYKDPRENEIVFCSTDLFNLNNLADEGIKDFRSNLDREITLHFPEIDKKVKELCYGISLF